LMEDILNLYEKILTVAAGVSFKPDFRTYDDLDPLADTWSEEDERQFQQGVEYYNEIDQDLFSFIFY
nr:hypothetical protein [Desulfobacula sp.]